MRFIDHRLQSYFTHLRSNPYGHHILFFGLIHRGGSCVLYVLIVLVFCARASNIKKQRKARDSTGKARDSTGKARDSTGKARDSTGKARDSTGKARKKILTARY